MMTLDKNGNYGGLNPWVQPQYGYDAQDKLIEPPEGYIILAEGTKIERGDIPFDVYEGWLTPPPPKYYIYDYSGVGYNQYARSKGRWTTWSRPKK